jgi:hypothetical protein
VLNDPSVVVAAVQQQAGELDSFMARPELSAGLAASPRDRNDEEETAAPTQCLAIGASAPSRLPLTVLQPGFGQWR